MNRPCASSLLVLASLVACGARAAAGVTVVDPAGRPGAKLLQKVLDTAQPGDILLLRAGDYSSAVPLELPGKGVVLVADTGASVQLPGLSATSLPASQQLLLRGLTLSGPPGSFAGLYVTGGGALWVEDCTCNGPPSVPAGIAAAGIHATGLRDCVITGCDLLGGDGMDGGAVMAGPGSAGLLVLATLGVVQDTRATGGAGGDGPSSLGSAIGGPGINGLGGDLSLLGGTFTGGDEGLDNSELTKPGFGGSFVGVDIDVRDTAFVAGQVQGAGTPTTPTDLFHSTLASYPAALRTLELSSPVRELQNATLAVHGEPGDLALLFVSPDLALQSLPFKQGVFLLPSGAATAAVVLGVTDAAGQLQLQAPMPRLPTGIDGLVLFTQLGVTSAAGESLVGTGSALVWVSAQL